MIKNVRLGFAANSSSTHSIVLLDPKRAVGDDHNWGEFGWDHFTLASKEAKKRYADVILRQAIRNGIPQSLQSEVARALDVSLESDDYIDHQSVPVTPVNLKGEPEFTFLKDFREYLVKTKGLVILGGNDNEDNDHPLKSAGKEVLGSYPNEYGTLVVRPESDRCWTLFNRNNGTRIVLDFGLRDPEGADVKLGSPLLVDLKITDLCHMTCAYCYQGSTKDGREAPMEALYRFVDLMKKMQVFEVAIGGGEPTTHQDFCSLLKHIKDQGLVPNFTTRNLAWLRDPANARIVQETCGTFAFSVDDNKIIEELKRALIVHEEAGLEVPTPQIQVVMGAISEYTLKAIFESCRTHNFPITLLGFKTTGRGEKYAPKPITPEALVKLLKECHEKRTMPYRVGIDTALARDLKPFLEGSDIPEYCYFTKEGQSSMYIDAVTNSIGPSSYAPDQMVKLEKYPKVEDILNAFRKW